MNRYVGTTFTGVRLFLYYFSAHIHVFDITFHGDGGPTVRGLGTTDGPPSLAVEELLL